MEVKDKVVTVEGLKGAYDNLDGKITQLNSNLNVHKTSTDHDSRYYTETEIDEKINKINTDLGTLLDWKLLTSALKKNESATIDVKKYKEVLLTFGVSPTSYAVDSVFIPVLDITSGFYNQVSSSHTIYYNTNNARIEFTITDSGVLTVTDIITTVSTWDPRITRIHVR